MSEEKIINLRIANLAPIQLKVQSTDELLSWRKAADAINNLWQIWCARFPEKTHQDIMGMIALRFAQSFEVNSTQTEEAIRAFDEIEQALDSFLAEDLNQDQTDTVSNS